MRRITGGREFAILDADTDPILDPVLPMIARALPVGVVCQIVRVADRTGCDCCEVTAEVVTAARQEAKIPQGEVGLSPLACPAPPISSMGVGHRSRISTS